MAGSTARTREQVYSTLFTLLQTNLTGYAGIPAIQTWSRRFLDETVVPSLALPALFLVQGEERVERRSRGLVRWEYSVLIVLYFMAPTISGLTISPLPVTAVNLWLDAIETVLLTKAPTGAGLPPGTVQTLGGLVNDTYLDGVVAYNQVAFDKPESPLGQIVIPVVMELGQIA